MCVGFSETLGSCDKWARLSTVSDNWRWNLGFWVRSHNQKTEFRVAHFLVTSAKEGPNEQIKSAIHAHHFLIQKELFTRSLCHPDSLWIKNFTYRYSSVWETQLCAYAMKLQTHGSFTMTIYQVTHHSLWGNFWLNIISQRFPTHRTALTWLRAISFHSPSSKSTSKDIILGQLKMPRQLWLGLWTTSQVKTSSTAMKSGSNAGIAIFDHKEPILKGINCNCMYVQ